MIGGGNFTTKSNVMRGGTLNGTTAGNKPSNISPNTKKVGGAATQSNQMGVGVAIGGGSGFGPGGQGL
jgi:hypothetical protein